MLRGFNAENGDHAYVTRLFLSEGPAPDHVEIGHQFHAGALQEVRRDSV